MSRSRPVHPRGFTLVEMLVVIGIIAMLMALFAGAIMWSVNAARRARMGIEVAALNEAIEKYKTKVGDYPPNFRDVNALIRHIRMRYPNIAPSEFAALFNANGTLRPEMQLDEGESLVFWLYCTRNDPQYPFGLTGGQNSAMQTYYEFDQRRLVQADPNPAFTAPWFYHPDFPSGIPSYRAAYAKDTFYLYLDSRSYDDLVYNHTTDPSTGAYAEIDGNVTTLTHEMVTRPYATNAGTPMNPTSFQILCAGQDGLWGNVDPVSGAYVGIRRFPGGMNYTPEDRDNVTNFSDGKTLEDHLP